MYQGHPDKVKVTGARNGIYDRNYRFAAGPPLIRMQAYVVSRLDLLNSHHGQKF